MCQDSDDSSSGSFDSDLFSDGDFDDLVNLVNLDEDEKRQMDSLYIFGMHYGTYMNEAKRRNPYKLD